MAAPAYAAGPDWRGAHGPGARDLLCRLLLGLAAAVVCGRRIEPALGGGFRRPGFRAETLAPRAGIFPDKRPCLAAVRRGVAAARGYPRGRPSVLRPQRVSARSPTRSSP